MATPGNGHTRYRCWQSRNDAGFSEDLTIGIPSLNRNSRKPLRK
jgi:hypothetical protein